ncbi:MAG TPA: VTT domain-containing protein [Silvibacterium sp.]|nr:VTT domain-containing protein [Silvibacterium sp.]
MPIAYEVFLRYAYLILFLWVMVEQLGAPIPSVPLILTAGTLTATHKLSLPLVLISVLLGCLVSDSIWYVLGKRYGGRMVKLLCRLSMERANCVRRTENYFTRHGAGALVLAKFIPGLGSVAAPIAAQSGMRYRFFAFFDTAGILLWALTVTLCGRFFGDVIKRNSNALAWVEHSALVLFLLLLIGFLIWRIVRREVFLREIRMARLEPDELKKMLDRAQPVYIVDLRHPLDYLPDPRTLPGAVLLTPDGLVQQSDKIPRDRDVVLFCTCPSEATAAKMALAIRRLGVVRVRPLRGGFDEWKRLGYPLVQIPPQAVAEAS